MAKIIDLDFYRKFKIILPARLRTPSKNKPYTFSQTSVKQYRRRRKGDVESKTTKKE